VDIENVVREGLAMAEIGKNQKVIRIGWLGINWSDGPSHTTATQGERNHLSGRNMVKLWSKRCDGLPTCFQRKDVGIMVAT
jgi:hypothetical protein